MDHDPSAANQPQPDQGETMLPPHRPALRAVLERALHQPLPQDPAGRETWLESTLDALEITVESAVNAERARGRRRLEEQQELIETIMSADPAGLAVLAGDPIVYIKANQAYRELTPQPSAELTGRTPTEVWSPTDAAFVTQIARQVIDEEASITLERLHIQTPEGPRVFTLHARPVRWEGQYAAALAVWETTLLERTLVEAEAGRRMLEALLEYIPEGITVLSVPEERVMYVSEYTAGLGGLRRSDMEGLHWQEYSQVWQVYRADGITPLPAEQFPVLRAAHSGEVIEEEEITLALQGRRVHLLFNAGPIRNAQGKIFAAVASFRDITERKRDEANQRFISEMAQALTPLTAPEQIHQEAVSRLLAHYAADRCYLREEREPGLEDRWAWVPVDSDRAASGAGRTLSDDFDARVLARLRAGKMVVVADAATDPLTAEAYGQHYAPRGMRAFLLAPWPPANGRAGALVIMQAEPRVWRWDEIALARAAASAAALALENATLFADLREFRYRFDLALRSAPVTVLTTNRDLRVTWIYNPPRGMPAALFLGRTPEEFDPENHGGPFYALVRSVLENQTGARQEFRFAIPGDSDLFCDISVEPMRDEQSQVIGLTVSAVEITTLRQMEAEAVQNLAHIEAQRRLIAERENERTRIARDLHDGPLQDLIAASYSLVEIMGMDEVEARQEKLRLIQSMLHHQIRELRRFCNELRPPALAPFGLEKTIRAHAETLAAAHPGLSVQLDLHRDERRLPEEKRMTLYRIYQELMNNVLRHAQASQVQVRLRLNENAVVLEVQDNGVGFAPPENWLDLERGGHLGLVGVHERAQMVGGQVTFDTGSQRGTLARVIVPL
jgi:PAS domain S-box-containing protein